MPTTSQPPSGSVEGLIDGLEADLAAETAARIAADVADAVAWAAAVAAEAALRVAGDAGAASGDLAGNYPNPTVAGITLGSDVRGDVYYRGAAGLARLGAGTSGQVLETRGAGADPVWASPSVGGGTGASNLINLRDYEDEVVSGNWTPALVAAIAAFEAATDAGDPCGGVFVPADPVPYDFEKPALTNHSIDLRGLSNFRLTGDGIGSVLRMAGSGDSGSWNLICISDDSEDITIDNLKLDGNSAALTDVDIGHTHLLFIGGTETGGTSSRVLIHKVTLEDATADGAALAGLPVAFGGGDDVSMIVFDHCHFRDCGRSGISNQRGVQKLIVTHCTFQGTSDQDIDLEPSSTPSPRQYIIAFNHFIHTTDPVCVTLVGSNGQSASDRNIFAFNQIEGGRMGGRNVTNLLVTGNMVVGDVLSAEATWKFRGTQQNVLFVDNVITRPAGAIAGPVLDIASTDAGTSVANGYPVTDEIGISAHSLETGAGPIQFSTTGSQVLPGGLSVATDYWVVWDGVNLNRLQLATSLANATADPPVVVDITSAGTADGGSMGQITSQIVYYAKSCRYERNTITTYCAQDGNQCIVNLTNAVDCSVVRNTIVNASGTTYTQAVRLNTTALMSAAVQGWEVSQNTIIGDGDTAAAGDCTYGIKAVPTGQSVSDIRANYNTMRGCSTRIFFDLSASPGSAYGDAPMATGNMGAGTAFAGIANVLAIMIGGNTSSAADYTGNGDPESVVTADIGSTFRRLDGSAGTSFYVKESGSGSTGWVAVAMSFLRVSTGDPEGVVTAPVGTLFLRTDGGSGTTLYSKTSGSGNTGWEAI